MDCIKARGADSCSPDVVLAGQDRVPSDQRPQPLARGPGWGGGGGRAAGGGVDFHQGPAGGHGVGTTVRSGRLAVPDRAAAGPLPAVQETAAQVVQSVRRCG